MNPHGPADDGAVAMRRAATQLEAPSLLGHPTGPRGATRDPALEAESTVQSRPVPPVSPGRWLHKKAARYSCGRPGRDAAQPETGAQNNAGSPLTGRAAVPDEEK